MLCQTAGSTYDWQLIGRNASKVCDLRCDCSGCWDEAGCDWTAGLTRDQLVEEGGATEGGVLCKVHGGKDFFEFVGDEDSRTCDLRCDCSGCWDEASCPWTAGVSREELLTLKDRHEFLLGIVSELTNTSTEQIINQQGVKLQEDYVCVNLEGEFELIERNNSRTCDLRCDCSGCWDEASCPWTAGVSREELLTQEDRHAGLVGLVTTAFQVQEGASGKVTNNSGS